MRLITAALCLLIAACSASSNPADSSETEVPASPAATEDIGFAPVAPVRIDTAEHLDGEVEALIDTLQTLVSKQTDPAKWEKDASIHFWRFQNRLERRVLSAEQEASVAAALDALAVTHPEAREYIERRRWMAQHLGIGKVAPDIVGKDFDNVEFARQGHGRRVHR